MTSSSVKGPGAYYTCGSDKEELYDGFEARYFVNHPNMKWIKTHTRSAIKVDGAIRTINPNGATCYVARLTLEKDGRSYTQIGLFWDRDFKIYYADPTLGKAEKNLRFEILTCQP